MTATTVTEPTNTVVKDKPTVDEPKPVEAEASETTEAPAPQEEAKDASKTETVADVAQSPEPESPTEATTEAEEDSSTKEEETLEVLADLQMPLTEEQYTSLVNARNTLAADGGLASRLLSFANDCEALNDEEREKLHRATEGLHNYEEYINALLKEHESTVAKQKKEINDLLDTIENGDLLQLSEEEVENLDPTQKEIYMLSQAYHSVPDEVKRAYDLLFPN